jgi:hypothetical protein
MRSCLQVRCLLGRGAKFFREVSRSAKLWMGCLGVSAVLAFHGGHEGCAASDCSYIDVSAEFLYEAPHDMFMSHLCSGVQSRGATFIWLVDVGTTFPEQAAYDIFTPVLGSGV